MTQQAIGSQYFISYKVQIHLYNNQGPFSSGVYVLVSNDMKTAILNMLRKHILKEFIIEKKKMWSNQKKKKIHVFTVLTILTLQIHVSHGTTSKRNNSNS